MNLPYDPSLDCSFDGGQSIPPPSLAAAAAMASLSEVATAEPVEASDGIPLGASAAATFPIAVDDAEKSSALLFDPASIQASTEENCDVIDDDLEENDGDDDDMGAELNAGLSGSQGNALSATPVYLDNQVHPSDARSVVRVCSICLVSKPASARSFSHWELHKPESKSRCHSCADPYEETHQTVERSKNIGQLLWINKKF